MARINAGKIRYEFNKVASEQKAIVVDDIQKQVYIFNFIGILGTINTTEAGYKPANTIINDFSTYQKVFTGRESVLFVWNESYDLEQVNKDALDGSAYIKKTYKPGTFLHGVITNLSTQTEFGSQAGFTTENQIKTVSIDIYPKAKKLGNNDLNDDIAEDIKKYMYQFFVIPEISFFKEQSEFVNNIGGSDLYKDQDKQWLYISDATIKYSGNTKNSDIVSISLQFSSLGNKLQKSGLAINEYIRNARPGQGYPYPYVDKTQPIENQVQLDKVRATSTPITHGQLSLYGLAGLNNMQFRGNVVEDIKDDHGNIIGTNIKASGRLYPYIFQAPEYDPLSKVGLHSTNFYATQKYESVVDSYYQNYKTEFAGNYDDNAVKNFEGHLRPEGESANDTIATNTPDNNNHRKAFWDKTFLATGGFTDYDFNVEACSSFHINPRAMTKDPNDPEELGLKTFNPSTMVVKGVAQWIMINSFIYEALYQVSYSNKQTTQYALNSLPTIGGFLNRFTFGMNLGFKDVDSADIPKYPYTDFLIDAEAYDSYNQTLYSTTDNNIANKGILPLDIFNNDNVNSLGQLVGTNTMMTAFAFTLTNRFALEPTKFDGTLLPTEFITGDMIGQVDVSDPNNKKAYLVNHTLTLESPVPQGGSFTGYALDSHSFQGFFKGEYRFKYFSQVINPEGVINDNYSVYQSQHISNASFSNNTRLWTNFSILGNPTYKFDEPFKYPQDIINPIPESGTPQPAQQDITWDKTSEKHLASSVSLNKPPDQYGTKITTAYNTTSYTFTGTFPIETITDYEVKEINIPVNLANVTQGQTGTLFIRVVGVENDTHYSFTGREIFKTPQFSKSQSLNESFNRLNALTNPNINLAPSNFNQNITITSTITNQADQGQVVINVNILNMTETSDIRGLDPAQGKYYDGLKNASSEIDINIDENIQANIVYQKTNKKII